MRHRAGLVLVSVLGNACASAPVSVPALPDRPSRVVSVEEALRAYDEYCKGIETMSASGDLDVRDTRKGKSQRLSIRIVAERGGRLYLKGSVAVVTALEVVADGRRFWFQLPRRKTVWTGAAEAAPKPDPEHPPYEALRPADVTAALLPEPLLPAPGESLVLEGDGRAVALTLSMTNAGRGTVRRKVWLDRESLRPVKARGYDEHGEVVSEATWGEFVDGAPRRVALMRPGDGYEASFRFDKQQLNVAVPQKAFVPRTPEGFKLIEVE